MYREVILHLFGQVSSSAANKIAWKRQPSILGPLSPAKSMELVVDKLSKSHSNSEFVVAMSG